MLSVVKTICRDNNPIVTEMMDRTSNLKEREFAELTISRFNNFCASLASTIHPTLAPTVGSQQVRGKPAPILKQGFLGCKICFFFGLQEQTSFAQAMFLKLMGQ